MFNTIFDGRVVAKLPFTPIYWIQVPPFSPPSLTNIGLVGAEPQKPAGRRYDGLQLHLPLHPLHHVHQVKTSTEGESVPSIFPPGKIFRKHWALHRPGQPASRQDPCGTQTRTNTSGTRLGNPKKELEEIRN